MASTYRRFVLLACSITLAAFVCFGCNCGREGLSHRDPCDLDPSLCKVDEPDAGEVIPPTCPTAGAVTGRVCATDQRTWVNGAAVSVDATDCHGKPVRVETVSEANGTFTLNGVPPGAWKVQATLGAFSQALSVNVATNATTAVPDNQLCVEQKDITIAVVTGEGDDIGSLLSQLNLDFTVIGGDKTHWASEGAAFFSNLSEMKKYDLIFIDCAAAKVSGNTIAFGPASATIRKNLADYVAQGGSLYSSDWALLFAVYAAPNAFSFYTVSGQNVADPLITSQLMGYAPQTVNASILDPQLAAFLNKPSVRITFPRQSGAQSLHWGLMKNVVGAQILASASQVITCTDTSCDNEGPRRNTVPLAVRVKVTEPGTRGGNVVYTSFHNGGQDGNDVAQILKYLILNL
ncbi:MAG: carboxypeptidase-like regulatory domain-containing protein [Myxococcaceae bacterium]|nr:carboxypeptidase-like regulatory domain-containing protein [Myxococcaceae bacterium]